MSDPRSHIEGQSSRSAGPDVEEIFNAALLRTAPAERAAYLDGACGSNVGLRARVEALLHAHERAGAFLDTPAVDLDATLQSPSAGPAVGGKVGPYKLLQLIGEGGFGAVYMAEQQQPVRRMVAVKIIKAGMDTRQVIARFEAERQALAMMDHPNIARVLDAGATETGRPYFVMELVRGVPITEYCDAQRLNPRRRLDLFIDVCHAVQHAHQKGIIHRDLKPSNVLVTLHDTRPVPKVIDFGIAKATSHRLTDKTLFTEFRQFIGTPEYMSPDQVEISGLDIDTRTDVYSLGVLLYELLTGTTPIDAQTLRKAPYGEIQRMIRETEPPMPSTRVASPLAGSSAPAGAVDSTARAQQIARVRQTDVTALRRLLRGDLDWIVMKAMEKDRTRRYQTANELATDIQRYVRNEPVTAGPPSTGYKLRKFVVRHRVGVMTGTLVAAALLVGLSLATAGFVQARRQAEHSQRVSDFLTDLTTRLDFGAGGPPELTVEETLDRAVALFGGDHAVIGSLLMTRSSALLTSGRTDEALHAAREAASMFRSRRAGDDPSVAAALSAIGKIHEQRGEYAEAERAMRDALAMKQRLFGNESRMTGDAYQALAQLLTQHGDQARHEEIRQLWAATLRAYEASLGRLDRQTVKELCGYATWLFIQGQHAEAEPLLVDAVERSRKALPGNDLTRFMTVNSLAQHRWLNESDHAAALPLVQELLELSEALWGADSFVTSTVLIQLVPLHHDSGDAAGAALALERYLDRRDQTTHKPHIQLVGLQRMAQQNMRGLLEERPELARRLWLRTVADARVALSRSDDRRGLIESAAAWMEEHAFWEDAAALYEELLAKQRQAPSTSREDLAKSLVGLGRALLELGRADEAASPLEECLAIRRETLPAGHWQIGNVISLLGRSLIDRGRAAEAEPLLLEANALLQNHPDTPAAPRTETLERLVALYEALGRPEAAETWRARLSGE